MKEEKGKRCDSLEEKI